MLFYNNKAKQLLSTVERTELCDHFPQCGAVHSSAYQMLRSFRSMVILPLVSAMFTVLPWPQSSEMQAVGTSVRQSLGMREHGAFLWFSVASWTGYHLIPSGRKVWSSFDANL